jgi:hypothetical protein
MPGDYSGNQRNRRACDYSGDWRRYEQVCDGRAPALVGRVVPTT